ncbi:MAG TPA: ester cyclase [Thermoanaerobaculia bacterium]
MKNGKLAAILVASALLVLPAAAQEAPPADPTAANKALVRRYIDEILSAGRLQVLDELLSADFVDSTPGAPEGVRGPEVIRRSQQRAREVFPEIQYKIDDLIAEGDKVVARYTVRAATAAGELSPSKKVEVTGITIFRIGEGKIREAWIVNDQVEMFLQLGYTLQPPQDPPKDQPSEPPPPPAPAGGPSSP